MKFCSKCGNEVNEDAVVCLKCGCKIESAEFISTNGSDSNNASKNTKKPIYKKWWFWVIIVLALAVIGSAVGDGDEEGRTTTTTTTLIPNASTSSTTTTTLIPNASTSSTTITTTTTTPDSNNTYHVGDVLTTNYLKIEYRHCEEWTDYKQYLEPEEDNKIVRVYFVIENISKSDQGVGSWDFKCYADGRAVSEYYYGDDTLPGYENISSGRKIEGYIYFEVPVNANEIEIEYEINMWTSKKVIFVVQ